MNEIFKNYGLLIELGDEMNFSIIPVNYQRFIVDPTGESRFTVFCDVKEKNLIVKIGNKVYNVLNLQIGGKFN